MCYIILHISGVTRDSVLTLAREFADELRPIVARSIKLAGMGRREGTNNLVDDDDDDDDIELTISERDVCVADLLDSVEVFVTGTAAEVVPVQSVGTSATPPEELSEYGDESEGEGGGGGAFYVKFPHGESSPGPVTTKLLDMLREVLAERRSCVATENWLCDVYSSPEDFRRGGLR